jgi:hypothetical protein
LRASASAISAPSSPYSATLSTPEQRCIGWAG